MKYDFVLFENLYLIENHYKDLCIIAEILKKAGYTVAFADVFKEDSLCKVEGIPHITFKRKALKHFCKVRANTDTLPRIFRYYMRYRQGHQLRYVINQLRGVTKNVYVGSLTLATPTLFIRYFNNETNYYFWGLRASSLLGWKKNFFGYSYFISKKFFGYITKRKNIRLFVSNELIKHEFVKDLGIEPFRLILRPERMIKVKPVMMMNIDRNDSLHLLTIGTLRPFKQVEFCLDALRELNDPRIYYTIAGRSKDINGYEEMIEERMKSVHNVTRINRYIPDDEYRVILESCDFLVLCDGIQDSCASNGTMSEALLMGKPIIAPNFNPFKNEVDFFGVGLLYEYQSINSLKDRIKEAFIKRPSYFYPYLSVYQNLFLEDKVINDIKNQIEDSNNEN